MAPALDPERFAELRRDFPGADLADLLTTFVAVTTENVAALHAGAEAADAAVVRDAAHRLRGGCLSVGALELSRVAGRLEERVLARAVDDGTRALVAEATAGWTALEGELQSHLM